MWNNPIAVILSMIKTIFGLVGRFIGRRKSENQNIVDDYNINATAKPTLRKAARKDEYMKCKASEFGKVEKIDVKMRDVVSSIIKYAKKKDEGKKNWGQMKAELVFSRNVKPEQSEIPVHEVEGKLLRQCAKIPLIVENSKRLIIVYRKTQVISLSND